jgi:D-alanyl-D-alanine carboxypeptidase
MPNPPQEREADPAGPPVARRTWTRPVVATGLVVAVALALVVVWSGLTGGGLGSPVGAASSAASESAAANASASASASTSATGSPSPAAASAGASAGPSAPLPTPAATPSATPRPSAAASASPAPGPGQDPAALAARLDARLAQLRKAAAIPGVSVAIVWDDGRRWLGAAGRADIAAKEPMTTRTALALASVSKTLTAAVVLQLVGEGRLALDQPVAPLLPAYKLDRRITVRMLLDHTSGLPDYFLNPKIDKPLRARPDAAWTPERAWSYVPAKRPVPGKVWGYSNTNYLLLGELVEAITGRTIAVEVRARLLDPFALPSSWYQVEEKPRAEGATGYRRVAKAGGGTRWVPVAPQSDVMPFRSVVTAAGGAGSVAATALDAARWMGAFARGEVLPPDVQAAMIADAAVTQAMRAGVGYGLGIRVIPVDGRRALGHSGRYLGFRNVVLYVPEAGLSIAVLTNQGTYDPAKIATHLLRIAAPRPVVTPSPAPSSAPAPAPSSAPSPSASSSLSASASAAP